jgi:predicted GIY-YIG superfamily endonuclease
MTGFEKKIKNRNRKWEVDLIERNNLRTKMILR